MGMRLISLTNTSVIGHCGRNQLRSPPVHEASALTNSLISTNCNYGSNMICDAVQSAALRLQGLLRRVRVNAKNVALICLSDKLYLISFSGGIFPKPSD